MFSWLINISAITSVNTLTRWKIFFYRFKWTAYMKWRWRDDSYRCFLKTMNYSERPKWGSLVDHDQFCKENTSTVWSHAPFLLAALKLSFLCFSNTNDVNGCLQKSEKTTGHGRTVWRSKDIMGLKEFIQGSHSPSKGTLLPNMEVHASQSQWSSESL